MTKPRLTAPQRARRKKIKVLITDARRMAKAYRSGCIVSTAQLFEDLADVAEEYLKEVKCLQR